MTNIFDPIKTPLEGTNLVEASAGTGKTYAITGLFLRLLLEKSLAVHQILVVTYTEAATEELKDRIRSKIREAFEAFSRGKSEDSFLQKLLEQCASPETSLDLLREALRTFDEAAIFTIHGFCRRMLQENAFESGSLFDTELIADPSVMIQECVDDFWRRHLYTASSLFVNYTLANGFSSKELLSLLDYKRNRPLMRIIPERDEPDTGVQEKAFRNAFSKAREAWPVCRTEVTHLLTSYQGLNKKQYSPSGVQTWSREMDDLFAHGENRSGLFPKFEKFSRSTLQEAGSLKKGFAPPEHPFFVLCEDLSIASQRLNAAFAERLLSLKVRMFKEVGKALTTTKTENNVQTFDDLLLRLHGALEGKGGKALAKAIGRKYRAALIDEFQDTDPVQYAIFQRIFGAAGSILFLVGDPKQSIYGFRGADIFAYMEAADKVGSHYTLVENWRSEPRLIQAVNALFSHNDRPFVYEKLALNPTVAADKKETELLTIKGWNVSPLNVWFIDPETWGVPRGIITKTLAQDKLPGLVAAEIARLLNLGREGKARIGKRPLRANDIAVLVRENEQARLIQKALSERAVPSVRFSMENLFESQEATEMVRFLSAVVEPNNESLLKAALSSSMLGMSGEDLERLTLHESMWEAWLLKFRDYHDLWHERGFIRMFRSFLHQQEVLSRLMALEHGERRNTNLLHLMEVMHQAAVERKLNMTGLLKWLSEQRDRKAPRSEEHQLRLESDENAVNLVTIHKSKGLEYPIVFCPFSWEGNRSITASDPLVFHDPQASMQLIMDLGSDEHVVHRAMAGKEELAENLRLLYVALTRAKCSAYLVWGRFNGAETSAPAYLLHPPETENSDNVVNALRDTFTRLENEDLLSGAKAVLKKPAAKVEVVGEESGGEERFSPSREEVRLHRPKRFAGKIDRQWKIASFSSLLSGRVHSEEEADYDALTQGAPELAFQVQEEGFGLFAFPKGAKAGIFFHDLFEHLDFQDPSRSSRQELVVRKLAQYGYDPSWMQRVSEMVDNVLEAPLDPERQEFCFSRVRNEDRLNELEFYFPLKTLSRETLGRLVGRRGPGRQVPERIEGLHFSPVRGFMKGFMDMVFRYEDRYYLVDWKSNVLGASLEDYGPDGLQRAMEENLYTLQSMIYTLALNRYLELRAPGYDYEKLFGGILYVFLRGVDPAKGARYGIYRDRPSWDRIEGLSDEVMGVA